MNVAEIGPVRYSVTSAPPFEGGVIPAASGGAVVGALVLSRIRHTSADLPSELST
jgi:hypothetical protein